MLAQWPRELLRARLTANVVADYPGSGRRVYPSIFQLLTYGIGRGAEYYDQPAVRGIVREAAASNYRWSSLIAGVVRSMPFRMKRSQSS